MSFLTKLREFFGIGKRKSPTAGLGKQKPPDDTEGSAGVAAKLRPMPPTLSGANARAFPPED